MSQNNLDQSIQFYVRGLFRGLPETEKIAEQREELVTHLLDRIADSRERGISEEQAFSSAVTALGNLDELIETMTGRKRKILIKKAKWLLSVAVLVYGTLYMTAVGFWFAGIGFGTRAFLITIPGWLGFAVPAFFRLLDWLRNPKATAVIFLDRSRDLRAAFGGWAIIAGSCWLINLLFLKTGTFLAVIWAWMPTFGILIWPFEIWGFSWMIHNHPGLNPSSILGKEHS